MKNNMNANRLRGILAFCLMLTVMVGSSSIALAKVENSLAGEIVVTGDSMNGEQPFVLLNGERALNGRTFFSSGVITTETSGATIKLEKLGYINLSPNSVLSLNFSENTISGKLTAGNIEVFNNNGVTVNIEKIENGKSSVVPSARKDDDDDKNSALIPILVFAGVVGTAVILVLANRSNNDNISPTR
ncbi:hypothetical protein BH10ACI1_BH10ACI1_14530 [soil metagenome]